MGSAVSKCLRIHLEQVRGLLSTTAETKLFTVGVIKAVKDSLTSLVEVTALWVTHRLEELYADGGVYMDEWTTEEL